MKKLIPLIILLTFLPGLNPALAKIDHYGFYFVENDLLGLDYMHELTGSSNTIMITYDHVYTEPQVLANQIRANGYSNVELVIGSSYPQHYLTTTHVNERFNYLSDVRKRLASDSDFLKLVSKIHIAEEHYTLLVQGHYDQYTMFQGMTLDQKKIRLKQALEEYITVVKFFFPTIPVTFVETKWGDNIGYYPPSNLDVLGLDAYYVPENSSCDATQRAKFDQEVTAVLNTTKAYGKPIHLVAPYFDDGYFKVLSRCQIDWYYNMAQNDPQITGLDWFLYADVPTPNFLVRGARNWPNGEVAYLKQLGTQALQTANPTIPNNNLMPIGSVDAITNGFMQGWAFDRDHPDLYATVHFYINGPSGAGGTFIGSVNTDVLRTDVNQAYGISGTHGFNFTIPSQYYDGANHSIYSYGIDWDDARGVSNPELYGLKQFSATLPAGCVASGNGARFVSQNVPTTMNIGTPSNVSITMSNCGSTTWTSANGYGFGDELNNNNKWGIARVGLPSSVSPGQQVTFNFSIQCPSQAGNYALQWRMIREGVEWFGQYNTPTTITCSIAVDNQAPSTPTNLAASVISSSQINLNWSASTDNVGVTGYRIYRNGSQVATTSTNSFSNTGLTASTQYSFTVAAYDAANNVSTQSTSVSATTQSNASPVVGDINLDHIVNSIDYSILNARWFTSDAAADLNDDGIVNGIDYSILNSNWFRTW